MPIRTVEGAAKRAARGRETLQDGSVEEWAGDNGKFDALYAWGGSAWRRSGRFFPELVAEMSECRRPADHEGLINRRQEDLDRFVSRHETPPRRGGGLTQRTH
ncbi:MAG TPA: hypothetical protein VE913_24225 [Longimicrobium sp.]|nr:hypothetical protein [Longimicrobium sp.]